MPSHLVRLEDDKCSCSKPWLIVIYNTGTYRFTAIHRELMNLYIRATMNFVPYNLLSHL